MPSCKDLLVVTGRFGRALTATVLLSLGATLVFADHGVPSPARTGFGWMSWLLVAGAVIAVGLAAWAFFAPDREPNRGEPPDRTRPETRAEPPAR
jgi:drug/metabolite transporter (DMT)-like permease